MRISVVIPTFNAAAFVVEAVQSVLAQSLRPLEIIVVDDGSTDDTAERLQSLPITLIQQANAGVAMARNAGIHAARGDAIAFLDADDVWHPFKLEVQVPRLKSHGLLASGCYDWPGPLPVLPSTIPLAEPIALERLVVRNSIVTSTVLVRRDALTQAGDFDARMQGPEDYDLWLRIAQHHECAVLPLSLTGYRTVVGSLSKNAVRMEQGMTLILGKLDAAGVFAGKPLLRRKAHGYFHYSCGYMHKLAGHRRDARRHALRSLLNYPLPFDSQDVRYFLGRLRLLARA